MATCGSSSSPGKSRSTTWKNYSIDHCDQTVTCKMIQFPLFGSLYQGQPKVWLFVGHYNHLENQGQRPGKITPPSTVAKRWQIWWLGLRCLEACIKGNLKYATSWSLISPGKTRSTTWKNYSTEHCGQTVTGIMIWFAVFWSLHQQQPKVGLLVGIHHHLEKQGQRPGKVTPPRNVTERWPIRWFGLRCLVAFIKRNLRYG